MSYHQHICTLLWYLLMRTEISIISLCNCHFSFLFVPSGAPKSQKRMSTATRWPQTQQSRVLSCQNIWPKCWKYRQNWICPIFTTTVWIFHLSFRWRLQESTRFALLKVFRPTVTAPSINGTGATSRGDTATATVRCGRDAGKSSTRDPGRTRTTKRDIITHGKENFSSTEL